VIRERNRVALELFAPLGPTYDRYANLLSFGQDPRWRRFLVSRIDARPGSHGCSEADSSTSRGPLTGLPKVVSYVRGPEESNRFDRRCI
jgi:hypothetical protein